MKQVGIADLKAHLSGHLRAVKKGELLLVMDRGTPVTRLLPVAAAGSSRHLVSAMGWREQFEGLFFATHDLALAAAARACGFESIGAKQP